MNLQITLPPGNGWNPECELSFLKWQFRTEQYLKNNLKSPNNGRKQKQLLAIHRP